MEHDEDFDPILEAVRDMISEFPDCDHLILSEEDAENCGLPEHIDDTGQSCFLVDGKRVYIHPDCPSGQIGACTDDGLPGINCSTEGSA